MSRCPRTTPGRSNCDQRNTQRKKANPGGLAFPLVSLVLLTGIELVTY